MQHKRLVLSGGLIGLACLVALLFHEVKVASGQAPLPLQRPELSGVVRFPRQVPAEVREAPAPPQPALGADVDASNNSSPQNETAGAVDPTDPSHIVAGANDYRLGDSSCGVYSSADAGGTWGVKLLDRLGYVAAGDPSVAIDAQGKIRFGCLQWNRNGNQENAIVVHTSTDRGQTFTPTIVAASPDGSASGGGVFHDKPYLAVGPGGAVYVSWTQFVYASDGSLQSANIVFAYKPAGMSAFLTPVVVSDTRYNQGSVPVVGTDSAGLPIVSVAWLRYPTVAGDPYEIRIDRVAVDPTTGAPTGTFGADTVVRVINPIPSPFSGQSFRSNSFPTVAAHGSNFYLAWAQRGVGADAADIVFSRFTDGGTTWSAPIRVNKDATTRDQFFPWMAVDGFGNIHLIWYDKRDDRNNKAFHTYYAQSRNYGASFESNQRVSDRASKPAGTDQFGGKFIGDYNGIAADPAGTAAYPVFMAYRPVFARFTDQEVYTDIVP